MFSCVFSCCIILVMVEWGRVRFCVVWVKLCCLMIWVNRCMVLILFMFVFGV